jgi:predicted RNA-binding Zn ribbon-like protein
VSTATRQGALASSGRVFERTGGRLALDFANTVDNRPSTRRRELLETFADLVAWGGQAGVVEPAQARAMLRKAALRPREAAAALRHAREFREALYGVASAVAAGSAPAPAALRLVEGAVRTAAGRARLRGGAAGLRWEWDPAPALGRVLWPVARDAADLLTTAALSRVRECAAEDCGWLFLDESRNASRIWCNMQVCGNRAKARRHYARTRRDRART